MDQIKREKSCKLSIITVNLNNKEGLQKTVSSVLSQNVDFFEFLVIDGESTDGSLEVISRNQNRISFWVSEPDNGVYQAMNKGIRAAKGEYLLFLNSGDYLVDNDVLNRVFAEKHSEDLLYGISYISKDGNVIYTTPHPEKLTLNFFYTQTISHQAAFIKKSLFEKFGNYREDFKINSDFEFWIRTIILNNCTVKKLNIIVSYYNLEGISSNQEGIEISRIEVKEILKNTIPARILEDYSSLLDNKNQMQVLEWIKCKHNLYRFNALLFQLASKAYSFRQRIRSKYFTKSNSN